MSVSSGMLDLSNLTIVDVLTGKSRTSGHDLVILLDMGEESTTV